jgi:3'(2'), 5'-bisphosphate nucleotidase
MKDDLNSYLHLAAMAAIEAGKRIMEIYETDDFDVDFKSDNSPLTRADVAAHEIIVEHLNKTGIPVLSEEGKHMPYSDRKDWNTLWIVDPIDGTKEFIKKNGEFTVNIALVENQIPILGIICVPALDELYFSTKENGAYKSENIDQFQMTINVLKHGVKLPLDKNRSTYTIVASRSHLSEETQDYIDDLKEKHGSVDLISKGSSLKLCMVAEGAADCYPRFAPTMEWDTAAGQAICMHAGFDVIDWKTQKTMLYNRENLLNNWFLVK